MLSEQLPIYHAVFNLSKDLYNAVRHMERVNRIMFGERMTKNVLNMLTCILNANSEIASERIKHLNEFKVLLEEEKALLRFCGETKIFNTKQTSNLSLSLGNISKQLTGWRDSTLSKMENAKNKQLQVAQETFEEIKNATENVEDDVPF